VSGIAELIKLLLRISSDPLRREGWREGKRIYATASACYSRADLRDLQLDERLLEDQVDLQLLGR
jgi:hypothetical protein